MTTPHDVFLEARKRGLWLEPRGDHLAVMPKGVCPPDFDAVLRKHKSALLHWLKHPPCPGWQAIPPDTLLQAMIWDNHPCFIPSGLSAELPF